MRGVFLHVLGDALGSVIVIISALLIWFVEDDWKYYMDPAMRYCLYFVTNKIKKLSPFDQIFYNTLILFII